MSLITRLKEWCSTGDKVQPSDGYIATGWAALVRPPRQYWNWVENTRDVAVNKALDEVEASRTRPPQSGESHLCQNVITEQWAQPTGAPNYLETGKTIDESCLSWDWDADRPEVLVLYDDLKIAPVVGAWDYETSPTLGSDLTLPYPDTPALVFSLCSDADYLYVLWRKSGGNFVLTKFDKTNLSHVWTSDTGLPPSTLGLKSRVIVANNSWLSILTPGNGVEGATTGYGVVMVQKSDGTGYSKVELESGGGEYQFLDTFAFVSDEKYVYFPLLEEIEEGVSYVQLCRFSISSSPASTHFIARIVDPAMWATIPSGLKGVGQGKLVMASPNGRINLVDDTTVLHLVDLDYTAWDGGDPEYGVPIGFDGINLWFLFYPYGQRVAAPMGVFRLTKIPLTECNEAMCKEETYPDRIFPFVTFAASGLAENYWPGDILFDGRDMWIVLRNGNVYRVCAPGLR